MKRFRLPYFKFENQMNKVVTSNSDFFQNIPGTQNPVGGSFQDLLTMLRPRISILWTARSLFPQCTGGQTGWPSMAATGRSLVRRPTALLHRVPASPLTLGNVYRCLFLQSSGRNMQQWVLWRAKIISYFISLLEMKSNFLASVAHSADIRVGLYKVLNKLFAKVSSIWSTNYSY